MGAYNYFLLFFSIYIFVVGFQIGSYLFPLMLYNLYSGYRNTLFGRKKW